MERIYHSDVNIVCLSAFCRRPRNENLMSQFYFNVGKLKPTSRIYAVKWVYAVQANLRQFNTYVLKHIRYRIFGS